MNRGLTNLIRHVMDEWLPPVLRDRRWFMRPFFYVAYRGRAIDEVMDFKRRVWGMSAQEYRDFYDSLNSISRNRETDLSRQCLQRVLLAIKPDVRTLLDVGCGRAFFLQHVRRRYPAAVVVGSDIKTVRDGDPSQLLVRSEIERLPFVDKSFDVVTCHHTIEHLRDLQLCIGEMLRVARHQLIIVTPRQRYYFFTLDEHINFFPDQAELVRQIPLSTFECEDVRGDWLYIGQCG